MKKEDLFLSNYFPYNKNINMPIMNMNMNMNIKKGFDFDNQKLFKGYNNLPNLQLPPFKMENKNFLKFSSQNSNSNNLSFITNFNNENSNHSQEEENSFIRNNGKKDKIK